MVANGMRDAGYVYIVIDDCWSKKERDADGNLVADPVKFPHGMKALGDYLHSKGFKFGMYGCAGKTTCGGYPGGRGHEFQDARDLRLVGRRLLQVRLVRPRDRQRSRDLPDHERRASGRRAGRSSSASANGARTSPGCGPSRSATSGGRRATSGRPTSAPAQEQVGARLEGRSST